VGGGVEGGVAEGVGAGGEAREGEGEVVGDGVAESGGVNAVG
jgi:hypothetical protein